MLYITAPSPKRSERGPAGVPVSCSGARYPGVPARPPSAPSVPSVSVCVRASGSAVRYGVGAWHLVNNRRADAVAIFQRILSGADWPSFGFLAAEAEMARSASPGR